MTQPLRAEPELWQALCAVHEQLVQLAEMVSALAKKEETKGDKKNG